jgi:TolB-like protein
VTESTGAVFISYASEDAEAAQRICHALSAVGIEVWFDQSELRGGDAWDQKIRDQIHGCRLFIAVISANTERRDEGYFRREWRLAVERAGDMLHKRTFIVPVVIDGTTERGAAVPDQFRELQWTRLPAGATTPAFVEQIRRLLLSNTSSAGTAIGAGSRSAAPSTRQSSLLKVTMWGTSAIAVVVCVYLVVDRIWLSGPRVPHASPATSAANEPVARPAAAFNPPPHSIAVLPFVNMSGDASQDYFAEGLTEELLDSLSRISALQVAARTSSFAFQGEHPDIATVARKLNVGAVLEGSVRRSKSTVRITAQLVNATTGFHLWSKSYDRDLGDVLKLQTEIATAVAEALKVKLLADISQDIELGGTRNPAALDAYMRASKVRRSRRDPATDTPAVIAAYTDAIRLDPNFALAFAERSSTFAIYAGDAATGAAIHEALARAEADARQALALAPELAQAHQALGFVFERRLEFASASQEYERAVELAPGNAQVLRVSGGFASLMGHFDAAIAAERRSVVLDPLARSAHMTLGHVLAAARRYEEAVSAYAQALSLSPNFVPGYTARGLAFYGLADLDSARTSCETGRDYWVGQQCLAVVYDKLGRNADAEAEVTKLMTRLGDAAAYQYATIYAQRGDRATALGWLETAFRLRDSGLVQLKTDPLMDPLRNEPRFQAIERALKFPG